MIKIYVFDCTAMKKILIVDDHGIVRAGVKILLSEFIANFEYFQASSKEEALKIMKDNSDLNLIILDINIPNYSVERMIENCKFYAANAKIMIFSMNSEALMAKRFYQLGVDAYVNKGANDDQLKLALTELLNGNKYFSIDLLTQLANDALFPERNANNPFENLSQREKEVLHYLFEGKSLQEISTILSIHSSSIGTYKTRIFEKMNTHNLIELYELYKLYNNTY